MKKEKRKIILFILFSLITAGISAQTGNNQQTRISPIEIKALVFGGFNVFSGSTNENDELEMGGLNAGKGQIEVKGEKESFGGWLRLGYEFEVDWFGDFDLWWRPSEKFAFYITYNEDGHFPLDYITGWNFYGLAGDVLGLKGCAENTILDGQAFYGGFKRGAFITINPIPAFEINLGMNMFQRDTAEFMFKSATLQLVYDLNSKGKIGFTYEGDYMTEENLDDNPILSFYYNNSVIKNVEFDVGLRFRIMDTRELNGDTEYRYHPVHFGFGAVFPHEKGKFKVRISTSFLGHYEYRNTKTPDPFEFGIDILPSFSLSDSITGYLNCGIGFSIPEEGDSDFFWRINPYIIAGTVTSAAFYAGIDFFNTALNQDVLHFTIPVGISIKF